MNKLLLSTPKKDGFYMPIESITHKSTWMIWSLMKKDNWQKNCQPAREVFANKKYKLDGLHFIGH